MTSILSRDRPQNTAHHKYIITIRNSAQRPSLLTDDPPGSAPEDALGCKGPPPEGSSLGGGSLEPRAADPPPDGPGAESGPPDPELGPGLGPDDHQEETVHPSHRMMLAKVLGVPTPT